VEANSDTIKTVKVDLLKPLPIHFSIISEEEEQMIIEDMRKGLDGIDPILVRRLSPSEVVPQYPNAVFEVVDGHTRLKLAKKLGWEEVKVRVIECTQDDALIINYRRNKARGTVDPLRTAMLVSILLRRGYQPSKIAELLSLPEPETLRLLEVSNIDKEALKKLLSYTEQSRKILSKDFLLYFLRADKGEQMRLLEALVSGRPDVSVDAGICDDKKSHAPTAEELRKHKKPKPQQSFSEFTVAECPCCGAKLRVYWLQRKLEWL